MATSISNEEGDLGFQIAPMIDVVFVLLLFFMASAGAKVANEFYLAADLPTPGRVVKSSPVAVDIEISSEGQVVVNGRTLGLPSDKKLAGLRAWFKEAHERFGSKDPVTLHPAPDARQERVMDVLNACASAQVPNVAFR